MNSRLVLMILLCSTVGNVVGLDEKPDQCRPCEWGEYFLSWFNPSYYFWHESNVREIFSCAVKENNTKAVRAVICCAMGHEYILNSFFWYSMKKKGLEVAIKEGHSEIVEFLVRDGTVSNDGIFFIDKLIENEHKHKDPMALAKVMEKCGVLPYFADKGQWFNTFGQLVKSKGKFVKSKYLESGSKSEIVQYYLKTCEDDIEKKKKEIEKKLKEQAAREAKTKKFVHDFKSAE